MSAQHLALHNLYSNHHSWLNAWLRSQYRRGHLGCTDDIAGLRLSGVYRLADTDQLLAMLPKTLPVQLNYRTRWWITLQRQA